MPNPARTAKARALCRLKANSGTPGGCCRWCLYILEDITEGVFKAARKPFRCTVRTIPFFFVSRSDSKHVGSDAASKAEYRGCEVECTEVLEDLLKP